MTDSRLLKQISSSFVALFLFSFLLASSTHALPINELGPDGAITLNAGFTEGSKLYFQDGVLKASHTVDKTRLFCEARVNSDNSVRANHIPLYRVTLISSKDLVHPSESFFLALMDFRANGSEKIDLSFSCEVRSQNPETLDTDEIVRTLGSSFSFLFYFYPGTHPALLNLSKIDQLSLELGEDLLLDPYGNMKVFKSGTLFSIESSTKHPSAPYVSLSREFYGRPSYFKSGTQFQVTSLYTYLQIARDSLAPTVFTILETNKPAYEQRGLKLYFQSGDSFTQGSLEDLRFQLGNVLKIVP